MLLAELQFPPEELAYGHTKIFIRSPQTVSVGLGVLAGGGGGHGVSPALSPPSPSLSLPTLLHLQLFDLEKRRQQRVAELATLIQATFRGWRCRKQYQQMRKSQILISAWFRGHAVRRGVLAVLHPSPFTPWPGGVGGPRV